LKYMRIPIQLSVLGTIRFIGIALLCLAWHLYHLVLVSGLALITVPGCNTKDILQVSADQGGTTQPSFGY